MMRAPKWQIIHEVVRQRFWLNRYRVLLTRGRAGVVIYVPRGGDEDPTRPPKEFEAIAAILEAARCAPPEYHPGNN